MKECPIHGWVLKNFDCSDCKLDCSKRSVIDGQK